MCFCERAFRWGSAILLALAVTIPLGAQINTVNLTGTVLDPQGLAVVNAKITVRNQATAAERSTTSDSSGNYQIVGLPPGHYSLTVEAQGFAKLINSDLVLTLGLPAGFNPRLALPTTASEVEVTSAPELIETTKTQISQTVTPLEINNLPINKRDYINFTLLNSQTTRDSAPSIGAAPTSGLNIGGQRGRSNEVSVDGADAVDNSVNGVRATVSQEAVQEFQLITNSYMPEFGRAIGGVVNIVTKSGSNQMHGDLFGFLRHRSIQARNPFSVQVDPATGAVKAVKQPFTRVQAGATLGGALQKDKTFYFFSYELLRRQETGFTNIGAGNFGLVSASYPFFPQPLLLTAPQQGFVNQLLASGVPALQNFAAQYAVLAGSGSQFGLTGFDFGAIDSSRGVAPCAAPTPQGFPCFPVPVPGPSGSFSPARPLSFVPLRSLIGNYPIKEGTGMYSLRLDRIWNPRNSSFVRVSVSPSLVTGIQVNAQNQNFGQNAGSRTSLQQARDLAVVVQHVSALSDSVFNEARYQFARRGLHYGFSTLPGGSGIGVNITGFAFFGREPFSTVDRIERRNQWTDNLTWIKGRHTMKFGLDTNLIQVRSNKPQIFELNFGGVYNFGGLTASTLGFPSTVGGVPVPDISAVQAYGLGLPQVFIQGIGQSNRPFNNVAVGGFGQDSWKINPRFTLNYGVRYDIELTPRFRPGTVLNALAEPAMGVVEGIPVDRNNVQPRMGFAWDPFGTGKTVIRGGYGLFYDHPLLAVAFNSTTADGALSSQLVSGLGAPSGLSVLTSPSAMNAASIFQGIVNTGGVSSFGYLPNEQRFNPFQANSIFTNQNFISAGFPIPILPFTLPVAKNFVYGNAQQANLTIERELAKDLKFEVAYTYTHGVHLNRPRNINTTLPGLLVSNANNAIVSGLVSPGTNPLAIQVPLGSPGSCVSTSGGGSMLLQAPGILGVGFAGSGCSGAPVGPVGTPAVFNFFRPSGPNPSFAGLVPGGYSTLVALATSAGFPAGFGVPIPWSDVLQQESSGNSVYHGLTVTVSKRFSHHFELLSNYTWSHAIDDSTDLQTLLAPQDNRFPQRERGNSTFDQRHRWVTSAVFESPYKRTDEGWGKKFLADFVLAPIIEVSSGRPFTVLTGRDFNLDFGSNTDRPSVAPAGTPGALSSPFIRGVSFVPATVCTGVTPAPAVPSPPTGCTGNLGRNVFVRPGFFSIDLRVSRKFYVTERFNLEVIADGFNLLNRFNTADVNPLCDPTSVCTAGQRTAALDPRQFQFAMKLNW